MIGCDKFHGGVWAVSRALRPGARGTGVAQAFFLRPHHPLDLHTELLWTRPEWSSDYFGSSSALLGRDGGRRSPLVDRFARTVSARHPNSWPGPLSAFSFRMGVRHHRRDLRPGGRFYAALPSESGA